MLDKVNVLLGVTGGIAAYKAVDLAGKLTAAGARVNTVMTENACCLVGQKALRRLLVRMFLQLYGAHRTNFKSAI